MESTHVAALQAKHHGLEQRLRDEMNRPAPDNVAIQAIKKQKLQIKQEIAAN
ncbi:hypothetical protein FHS61_000335 [Altererythrobacter atlanticus]|uniref:Uncharacterized protein n=1 Tax=Croceibacterium atlanticum TaxID=1267766 RepID=A0A0F7KUW9_9SPHN|nr:YdcH family protein [Croceibacterium atlanticum]AKH42565.1 hypothetical protein WYH_01526 [Croceibacterium atlanticum]MBB5731342.1 hypothetical protein [Croceibacterium atlanticum]